MEQETIQCPHCGQMVAPDAVACPHCAYDLAALARLHWEHAIHHNAALVLAQQGDLELARARLLLALERNEGFVPSHTLLAKVNARLGRWAEAQQSARRAAELAPDDEAVQALLPAIERAEQEAIARQQRRQEQLHSARAAVIERYIAQHQTELALAFGAGAGLAAILGVTWRALFGGGGKRR